MTEMHSITLSMKGDVIEEMKRISGENLEEII